MKIISDPQTRRYELTYLIPAAYTDTELKAIHDEVAKLVKRHKGTVIETDDWGKKQMAYTIRKAGKAHREAVYTHMVLEFETTKAPTFEKEINLVEEIIRHLFVVAENASAEEPSFQKDEAKSEKADAKASDTKEKPKAAARKTKKDTK